MQKSSAIRWPILLGVIVLTYLVCAVFFPLLSFDFIDYDVGLQVTRNPHVWGLTGENLKHIFTSWCVSSYYPVRTLTFAVDYQLWGLNPGGVKLTNGLIHLTNGRVFSGQSRTHLGVADVSAPRCLRRAATSRGGGD